MELSENHKADREIIPSAYLGMVMYLFTEIMFFSALLSAYIVGKAGAMVPWPPEGQPRLPITATFVNTLVLLSSSLTLFIAYKSIESISKTKKFLIATITLGSLFLLIQGYEWIELIGFGMTSTSNLFAGFFYTIVGMHGLHVFFGVLGLNFALYRYSKNPLDASSKISVKTIGIYWFFVVYLWPFIYYLLYLY